MLEYLPWSKAVLEDSLREYKAGRFSILDIELSGACNFSCIYCDSPNRSMPCRISVKTIERFLQSNQIKWIHICGLGEPTYKHNYEILINILKLCEAYGVRCNMFSNIYNLTTELVNYIKKGILFILFKMDTINSSHAANLYGIDVEMAKKQIENTIRTTQLVMRKDGCTNLAASIVPTNINAPVIASLVKYLCDVGIFPMIGDLENSGRGREHFEALNLYEGRMRQLEREIDSIVGSDYTVPQCPAVISSVHISANNEVVVDEFTGLSCNWFWLEEPRTKRVTVLSDDMTLEEVSKLLKQYRELRLPLVKEWLEDYQGGTAIFGGCGGDIITLLNAYLSVQGGIE